MKLDFQHKTCNNLGVEFDTQTCLSKVAAIKDKTTKKYRVYAFGGANSEGAGYLTDLSEETPSWKALDKSYLSLFNGVEDRNLLFKQAVYF